MSIKVADNQLMIAQDSTEQEIKSQPIRLPPNSSVSIVLSLHYILNITGNVAKLTVNFEYSNDGLDWSEDTTAVFEKTAAGNYNSQSAMGAGFEFLVVKFTLDPDSTSQSGTGTAGAMFSAAVRTYEL